MVFMDQFLYFNWISWNSCYYGTIFICVQLVRVIKEHLKPKIIWVLKHGLVLALRGCYLDFIIYYCLCLWF
jgi:hypothetical protein